MQHLIRRYEKKLVQQGLAEKGRPLLAALETDLIWNRRDRRCRILETLFQALQINALCFSRPAEPYRSMIDFLSRSRDTIHLKDNETRLFLHDVPVVHTFSAAAVAARLKQRKAVVVPGHGIITCGTVSPEQTFVVYSSVLFACFVQFMADFFTHARDGVLTSEERAAFEQAMSALPPFPCIRKRLQRGPFPSVDAVYQAISEAGKPVVRYGLVDSVMGNVSFRYGDTLYISQTGSFLDELEGCIDPCPLDNSACTGITASSELPAHMRIVCDGGTKAVLHGHPKFAVIMSLICDIKNCPFAGQCHVQCPRDRRVGDIPIVPGETGAGPTALCNTVPAAMRGNRGVIVYGHGVFSGGPYDFNQPFHNLVDIEKNARRIYFEQLKKWGVAIP